MIPMHANEVDTAPPVVRNTHIYFWHVVTLLFFLLSIAQFVALDVMGGVNAMLMVYFIRFMVKDGCRLMSQQCLFLLGFMCILATVLPSLALLGDGGTRVIQTQERQSQSTFVMKIERHALFDKSKGWLYNLQSIVFIASPVVNGVAFIMCYISYSAFPTSMFADDFEDAPLDGQVRGGSSYGGADEAAPAPYGGPGRQLGQPPRSSQPRVFEGQGHRLGC